MECGAMAGGDTAGLRSRAALALASLWLAATGAEEVQAAVRVCTAPILAEALDDKSELAARKSVIELWSGEARKLGEAFAAWRLANDKSIACERIAQGFRCSARARPCGISQLPDQPPPGTKVPLEIRPRLPRDLENRPRP